MLLSVGDDLDSISAGPFNGVHRSSSVLLKSAGGQRAQQKSGLC